MNIYKNIISEICNELGIKVTNLSDDWLTVLEKDNKIHYINGYKFDLNNHGIGEIMDNKDLFHSLMVNLNLPVVNQINYYKKYDKEEVINYFHKCNDTLIIKGSLGTCGKNVYLVTDEKEIFKKMDYILSIQDVVIISPFYDIKNEYRVIILNNEVRLVYGKKRPTIIGDGVHTIKELAILFNPYFLDKTIKDEDIILKNGEEYIIDYRFNLSNGAVMFMDIDTDIKEKVSKIALSVTKKLNITFASIDIINTKDNELLVLEANSVIMMTNFIKLCPNGKVIAYDIYRDAIKLMFK